MVYDESFLLATVLNPIHTLFYPQHISDILYGTLTIKQLEIMNYWSTANPILVRYSIWNETLKKIQNYHVINESNFPSNLNHVKENADELVVYSSLEELQKIDRKFSNLSQTSTYQWLERKVEHDSNSLLLIEGFNI